jgi:hypothetical protein
MILSSPYLLLSSYSLFLLRLCPPYLSSMSYGGDTLRAIHYRIGAALEDFNVAVLETPEIIPRQLRPRLITGFAALRAMLDSMSSQPLLPTIASPLSHMSLPPPFSPSLTAVNSLSPPGVSVNSLAMGHGSIPALPFPEAAAGIGGGGAVGKGGKGEEECDPHAAAFLVIRQRQQWIMNQVQMHVAHRWQWQIAMMQQTAAEIRYSQTRTA